MRVLIVGASAKSERYAHMAMKKLLSQQHEVILFNPDPDLDLIEGRPVVHVLRPGIQRIDTVTIYVAPQRLEPMVADIAALKPRRIIANPGTECPAMKAAAQAAGIEYLEACTLVLLATGKF